MLHFERFDEKYRPLMERARTSDGLVAIQELRAVLTGLSDKDRRDDSLTQLERVDVAVQSGRWHRSAAGYILEYSCVEEATKLPDYLPMLSSIIEFVYLWNEEHAEHIYQFFSFLSDLTIHWASPQDTWRAVVSPDMLVAPAEAFDALTPRSFRKLLEEAENGDVFSPEEAAELAEWWGEFRKMFRLARRQDNMGLYVGVRDLS